MQPQELGPGNIWFPIAFVLIMMAAAALISAAADRMGHRAARRKLRIGNLRPRHVSTLIAIISGLLISLVTVGAMFLIWRDFYNALTQWDNLNGRLSTLSTEVEQKEQEAAAATKEAEEARTALAQAESEIKGKSAEIQQKTREITSTRGKLASAQSELQRNRANLAETIRRRDRAQAALASAERAASEARESAEASEFEVAQKQEVKQRIQQELSTLNEEVKRLEAAIARAETGQQVMGVGEQLGFIHVQGGAGGLEQSLQSELERIKSSIEARGLEFDPQSREKVIDFMGAFPADGGDYIVRIVSAENVFEGDRVLLDFTYDELGTLARSGTAIIDITLHEGRALISTLGGVRREVPVPPQFNDDTLIDFAVEVETAFQAGARAAGFVPGSSGEVDSPVAKLTQVAGSLMSDPRPLRIQFVLQRNATAVEGSALAGAELHVTSLPRAQERRLPDPEPEPEPAPQEEDEVAAPPEEDADANTPETPEVQPEDGNAG